MHWARVRKGRLRTEMPTHLSKFLAGIGLKNWKTSLQDGKRATDYSKKAHGYYAVIMMLDAQEIVFWQAKHFELPMNGVFRTWKPKTEPR